MLMRYFSTDAKYILKCEVNMNKSIIYMILIVLCSFTVVSGGWFLMSEMLDKKEDRIL